VWRELTAYLSNRDLIISELEREKQAADHTGVYESELKQVEHELKAVEREQHQLLQWALKGFPESQVEAENRRLNKATETLKAKRTELEKQLKVSQNAKINVPNLERFIDIFQSQLPDINYEGKRRVLDMLGITVWLDGENIEICGAIDPSIVFMPSSLFLPPFQTEKHGFVPYPVWRGGQGVRNKLIYVVNNFVI
jgi:hypothetical protein